MKMSAEQYKLIEPVLETITNADVKDFLLHALEQMPDYFYKVPTSSTGKYHPQYSCGEGGLFRHSISVVRFLNFFFTLEQYSCYFDAREMDLMRVAGMLHDCMKSGLQEEYELNKYTKSEHPLLAAKFVRENCFLEKRDVEIIAHAIEAHMGQWNTDTKTHEVLLPKPTTKYQKTLHLADYLSSRKDLDMSFDGFALPELPDVNTYVIQFGKHKGLTIPEIYKTSPNYVYWLSDSYGKEPVSRLSKNFLASLKQQ